VTRLATAVHAQAVHELPLAVISLSTEAAAHSGLAAESVADFMFSRPNTIGGGTHEISRNRIGERILGFPKGPALQ
jgi:hypothetical protein